MKVTLMYCSHSQLVVVVVVVVAVVAESVQLGAQPPQPPPPTMGCYTQQPRHSLTQMIMTTPQWRPQRNQTAFLR